MRWLRYLQASVLLAIFIAGLVSIGDRVIFQWLKLDDGLAILAWSAWSLIGIFALKPLLDVEAKREG